MRDKNEILNDSRILKVYKDVQDDKISKLKLEVRSYKASDKCLVCMTCVEGWEHLSVSHKNKIPSWLCMEEMKELFFKDDEEAFQFHPKMDNYVNNNEYALHIWRRTDGKMEPPPSILVGFRPGHEEEDMEEAKALHERIGHPLSEEEIRLMMLTSNKDGMKKLEEEVKNMDPYTLAKWCARLGVI